MTSYRMKYRPPGFATLPTGLFWEWTALPHDHPNPQVFPNLSRSNWPFGEFKTDRPLTAAEMRDYEIEEVA